MPIYPNPMPGLAPAPSPLQSAAAAEPARSLTQPIMPSPEKPKDWLDSVGKLARHVAMKSTSELARQNGYTARDRAVGNDKLPGLQMEARLDRTMKTAGIGKAPTREEAMEHFSRAIRPAVAKPAATVKEAGVDISIYDDIQKENPDLPKSDEIDDDDKAMLLMELGLRIMSADPEGGLIGALGQAGLGTMGTWREVRKQKYDRDIAAAELAREERRHQETLANRKETAQISADARIQAAGGKAPPTRTVVRGGMEETEEYDSNTGTWKVIGSGARWKPDSGTGPDGSEATTFMKDAQYLAKVAPEKFKNEGEAALFLKAAASDRANPEAMKQDIYSAALRIAADPIMLEEGESAAQAAARITEESMAYLRGGAAAVAAPEAPKPSKGVWAAIKSVVGMGDEEAAGPEGDPAIAAPAQQPQATQPTAPAQAPSKPIEGMSLEELGALDPYSLSDEDKARAADRWDALNGG